PGHVEGHVPDQVTPLLVLLLLDHGLGGRAVIVRGHPGLHLEIETFDGTIVLGADDVGPEVVGPLLRWLRRGAKVQPKRTALALQLHQRGVREVELTVVLRAAAGGNDEGQRNQNPEERKRTQPRHGRMDSPRAAKGKMAICRGILAAARSQRARCRRTSRRRGRGSTSEEVRRLREVLREPASSRDPSDDSSSSRVTKVNCTWRRATSTAATSTRIRSPMAKERFARGRTSLCRSSSKTKRRPIASTGTRPSTRSSSISAKRPNSATPTTVASKRSPIRSCMKRHLR